MKHLAAWYQKKISSYDKEEWETLVERLLMRGTYRRRVVDFSAQARSYLIDVDLVRGSSFPKAKPTLAWRRVAWFGLVRLVFLPALTRWWAQQTSPACARLLLALWTLEVLNIGLYCAAPKTLPIDVHCWLVPLALMVALSAVHAQIVSTTEMELARVRPRPAARRRTPRDRSECEGGASGESGPCRKLRPAKLRRRSRPDAADAALRKRKKDPSKDALNTDKPDNIKVKAKAKVSDDEDYMADLDAPTVTFTPPPEEAPRPHYRPELLTARRLARHDARHGARQDARQDAARAADDDGFESLNGSDADNRARLKMAAAAAAADAMAEKSSDKIEEVTERDDADSEPTSSPSQGKRAGVRFRKTWAQGGGDSSDEFNATPKKQKSVVTSESSSDGERSASAPSVALPSHHTMSDWVGQTTNSEESSYCSQSDEVQDAAFRCAADSSLDPFAILNPTSDTVKCTMWERGDMLRCELSAVDISWCVVARAERALATTGGGLTAAALAATAALLPPASRLLQTAIEQDSRSDEEVASLSTAAYAASVLGRHAAAAPLGLFYAAFGNNGWEISTNILSSVLRFALSGLVFFLLAVAERAYKQRFLYAKLFSHLTSARRARKSELPHFRLNTVRNIKTWLSARSYLRRRGPQRSVDVIVSAAFLATLVMLAAVAAHLLRDSVTLDAFWVLEALTWSCSLGVYLLRLLTLGGNVNRKYRGCLSAILTEQINLHLAMEQRPESKEQLTLANNVLKLAADLLKELDSPFKISGICANHYLYTITKVVVLSALSGVLSEMLGFKLKLHKIKIK